MLPPGVARLTPIPLLLLLGGCGIGEPAGPTACLAPALAASAVLANPHNVLSVVVSARVDSADSVAVRFGIQGAPLAAFTPGVAVSGDSAVVPVLGLEPGTPYAFQAIAFRGTCHAFGTVLGLETGTLPADLPSYQAGGSDPSPGYVVFAAGFYGLVIDNTGRVVWYRRFTEGPGLNFQAQPSGEYAARPAPAQPGGLAPWIVLDPLGNVTRTVGCARDLQPRFHDALFAPDGSVWLLCDETRVADLSGRGGKSAALVTATVVQHLSPAGALLFEWSAFDHFRIEDLALADRTGDAVNWTHGNALDLDADGNLLLSFRSLNEITKIDTRTGAVRWRMGGLANQFGFEGTATPAFFRQHGLRITGPSRFTLLDNLGEPAGSQAETYQYDEAARTVRLVASHGNGGVTALLGGTTQSLPGGRVLVAFGNGGAVAEYDAGGNAIWRISGNPGYVFRAQRIHSLYRPGSGDPR